MAQLKGKIETSAINLYKCLKRLSLVNIIYHHWQSVTNHFCGCEGLYYCKLLWIVSSCSWKRNKRKWKLTKSQKWWAASFALTLITDLLHPAAAPADPHGWRRSIADLWIFAVTVYLTLIHELQTDSLLPCLFSGTWSCGSAGMLCRPRGRPSDSW